ncbi:uncharacterized protein CDAR_226201 [Caerostris darwini]|uniref:Gustatory receptor n=1 Tax=Caerostris darwini TaxID=1538125 RepID=A0AAV4UM38_9ARAC|nr:uncharacterized protein CDAR_226201 [Caerostris darwini]
MHQNIEEVMSISAFFAYVLVFVNFLSFFMLNTTDFSSIQLVLSLPIFIIGFLWTASYFVKLTLTGSKLVDICVMWQQLQMKLVKDCAKMYQSTSTEEFKYFLVFIKGSKLDLEFTGGGMFQLDRSLLLTMSSAIVSYSVLAVTF